MSWIRAEFLHRLTACVLAAALLAQAGLATHALEADHAPGESCETCVGFDRSGDALAPAAAAELARLAGSAEAPMPVLAAARAYPSGHLARAPPML